MIRHGITHMQMFLRCGKNPNNVAVQNFRALAQAIYVIRPYTALEADAGVSYNLGGEPHMHAYLGMDFAPLRNKVDCPAFLQKTDIRGDRPHHGCALLGGNS